MASYLNYITVQFWPEIKLLQDILQPLFFMLINKHPFFLLTAGAKRPTVSLISPMILWIRGAFGLSALLNLNPLFLQYNIHGYPRP